MLTSDLLRARTKGAALLPAYISVDSEEACARAAEVLAVFLPAVQAGWSRGQIEEALAEVEGDETDHKLIRGLAKVLFDRCDFETVSPVEPAALRLALFAEAARRGPLALSPEAGGPPTAHQLLAEAAATYPPRPDGAPWTALDLEKALYADLPEAQVLSAYDGPRDEAALIERYNLVLVQSLLLRATRLVVVLSRPEPKRLRQLFRHLKFCELLFRLRPEGSALRLEVDGPASLLSQSTRYGKQLASFLPAIVQLGGDWTMSATLLWGPREAEKTLTLSAAQGLTCPWEDRGTWQSQAEKLLIERWTELNNGWALSPGELVHLPGQELLIPDLRFEKDGRVAFLDILGYWRKSSLERRLASTPAHVLLAVSKRLLGEKGVPADLSRQVILFAEVIPSKDLLARLEAAAIPLTAASSSPLAAPR
jgi:hypothetical protein